MGKLHSYNSFTYGLLILFCGCQSVQGDTSTTKTIRDSVKISSANATPPVAAGNAVFKNMLGINAFEWDFLSNPAKPDDHSTIYETNMSIIKSFGAFRHYMDWGKLEHTEGKYTFNPTNDGGWNYDVIYTRCKAEGITVLADLKTCPDWLLAAYPADSRDVENVPVPFAADLNKPASYVQQAMVAFQFAARYGANKAVNGNLVKVDNHPRWNGDAVNQVKIGLNLIKYIECDNERDKWWKGPATKQTPEQYAANMSAFYDGDKGKLGPNAGVKTADPAMKVVMGGLATCDTNFVKRMIAWCRANRGLRADGSVNLCFDVINYHYYANNGTVNPHTEATSGVAPELSEAGKIADAFVRLGKANKVPVWVTETGYDINQGSHQKAIPIGAKSALITQADWNLRTALLYARHGIGMLYYYMLDDVQADSATQYSTSGFAEKGKPRPTADYFMQAKQLIGNYAYSKTINANPLVDVYVNGTKKMYVLTVPDQVGRNAVYTLNLGSPNAVKVYRPAAGATKMAEAVGVPPGGKLTLKVTETPTFVEAN